jgi:CubicO group peptidase (beta-lactamase class C family)
MRRLPLLAALLLLVAVPMRALAAQPDFAEMDAFVQAHMQDRGIPGVAVAVIEGDHVVHQRGFGVADAQGRAVTPQTLFRIGSNTKGFTALAIMQLVEQGKIDLDAPVQRYLPWFHLADVEASAEITVEQVLQQTSGIPGSALYDSFVDPSLTLEQYGRDLATVSPDRPVGSAFEYANANYNLAGLVVEAVSGQSYADYVQQHIFVPLEMRHSTASPEAEAGLGLAQGHTWFFGLGPFPAGDAFNQANLPAGYISSTAEDLSHYLIAQLNGGRYGSTQVLSAEGVARLHQAPSGNEGYALGWGVGVRDGVHLADHTGETIRFISRQFLDLDNRRGLVVLTNATNQLPSDDEAFKTLARGLIQRVEDWPPASAAPSLHVQYAVVDVVLTVLSAGVLRALFQLSRWRRSRLALSWLRAAAEFAVGLGLLVFAPSLMQAGISWRMVVVSSPDLGWWTLIFASLLLVVGLLRALLVTLAVWRCRLGVRAHIERKASHALAC